jgi:Fe-S-cluster containining protein
MSAGSFCLACGACCFSRLDRYVRVTGDDHARLGEEAYSHTVFIEHRCYMRMRDGCCSALRISPCGKFVCSVYEHRPAICREIVPGGPTCQAERERKISRAIEALACRERH